MLPAVTETDCGLSDSEVSDGAFAETASEAEPLTEPELALIVTLPLLTAVTKPEDATVATVGALDIQVADAVMSFAVPSL